MNKFTLTCACLALSFGSATPWAAHDDGHYRTTSSQAFYDYAATSLAEATELIIPAELDARQSEAIRKTAIRAYQTLEAEGMARVDFLMDRESGQFYVNELNSLPGFTDGSMYPKLWEATGLPYTALLDRLIELALERHDRRAKLETQPPSAGATDKKLT